MLNKFIFLVGENFLHKDFIKIVKYAKQIGFYILINTNGFFDITPILDYSDEFVFSLHGYESVNDNIKKMKGTFAHVENNINLAVKENKSVLINTVLIQDNFDNYLKLLEYLESKYDSIKYSPTIAIECKTGKQMFNSLNINEKNMKKYEDILDKIGEEKIVYKHGLRGLRHHDNKKEFDMPVCAAGKSKLIIKYNGNVYPCNFFQTDDYICGNVFEKNVKEIWKDGKGFKKFRDYYLKINLPDKCQKCEKVNNCFSGCRAWTQSYINGEMNIVSEGDVRCELINAFIGTGDNNKM